MDDSLTQHSFVSNSGIEVKIHIGNKSLEAGETLRFEIVLTAYQGMIIFKLSKYQLYRYIIQLFINVQMVIINMQLAIYLSFTYDNIVLF